MNWRGKALGGSIGSMFGPWGALAGAAAGHILVDKKAPAPEKQALRLLAVTAGALYELAGVDGRYTIKEDKVIRAILGEINHTIGSSLAPHELAYLIDDAVRIDRSLTRLAATARANPPLARAAVIWLWRVAVSDSDETREEAACITTFAHDAGLSEDELRHASILYARSASAAFDKDCRSACSALGVPYHADPAEIKSAYRTLSQKYHPDKHAGIDPDIRALTAEKFAQIKAAYDTLNAGSAHAWFAKQADSGRLAPAAAESAVCCFACGLKCRLPHTGAVASARCPACQTLLVFERGLAEQLV
ncbi:MAG: J domain-containing protein [bacterium]